MDYGGNMIRLYVTEPELSAGRVFALDDGQSRYLTTVMRLHVNDEVAVFNGRDGEWLARIHEAGKKGVRLEAVRQLRPQSGGQGPVLVVSMVKRTALEYMVEKATELGVSAIHLVITHRSSGSNTNVERLISIAREAAEQTERLDIPAIIPPVKFADWLATSNLETIIFGDEESTHEGEEKATLPLLHSLQKLHANASNAAASVAVLIGPEGGFDDEERQMLHGNSKVCPVNLGPRILRADTAAISALTLVQAVLGDWR